MLELDPEKLKSSLINHLLERNSLQEVRAQKGKEIREIREKVLQLSIREMEQITGIGRGTILEVEKGRGSQETAETIYKALLEVKQALEAVSDDSTDSTSQVASSESESKSDS